jgi:hypothetical protein
MLTDDELPSIEINAPGITTIVIGQQAKSTLSVEQEHKLTRDMETAWRSVSIPKRV